MRKLLRRINWQILSIALMFAVVLGVGGYAHFAATASAGPQIVGNPSGATTRVLEAPAANGSVKRIVYFGGGVVTPAVTSTPVNSSPVCSVGGYSIYRADAYLTGTMTGTAPTLAILWQNSIDGGVTWTSVGAWTTINATVTPASQSQTVSDIVGSTAVAYGDCWRAQLQFGGTGAVGANVKIVGFAK